MHDSKIHKYNRYSTLMIKLWLIKRVTHYPRRLNEGLIGGGNFQLGIN